MMSAAITGVAPHHLLLLWEESEVSAGELTRRLSHQVEVGVALQETEHRLKCVGSKSITAVVGHVGHEDGDGVGDDGEEQLTALNTVLQPTRPPMVLGIVLINYTHFDLSWQHINTSMTESEIYPGFSLVESLA